MSGGHISVHREAVTLTLLLLALLGFAIKARYDLAQRLSRIEKSWTGNLSDLVANASTFGMGAGRMAQ